MDGINICSTTFDIIATSWNLPNKTRRRVFPAFVALLFLAIVRCDDEISESSKRSSDKSTDILRKSFVNSCSIAPSDSNDLISECSSRPTEDIMDSRHFVRTLGGIQMPKLIYGTAWKKERTTDLVVQAIRAGFRGIDTACQPKHYYEPGVGEALKVLSKEDGIPRESLFIQTKFTSIDGQDAKNIPYDPKQELPITVKQSLQASLRNLNTTYIDSLVMHSPMRAHRDTMEVWQVFESFVDAGKVRQLGISNCYSLSNFQKIYNEARIKPSVLQNRFYGETGHDKGLREFCKEKGIFYQSFWTLTANPQILSNSRVQQIAHTHKKTTPQILFAYLIQTGVVTPLTGTTSLQHMKEDLEALDINLTEDEMEVFNSIVNR